MCASRSSNEIEGIPEHVRKRYREMSPFDIGDKDDHQEGTMSLHETHWNYDDWGEPSEYGVNPEIERHDYPEVGEEFYIGLHVEFTGDDEYRGSPTFYEGDEAQIVGFTDPKGVSAFGDAGHGIMPAVWSPDFDEPFILGDIRNIVAL